MSPSSETASSPWIDNRDPAAIGADRIRAFPEDLAVRRMCRPAQGQALNALASLFKQIVGRSLEGRCSGSSDPSGCR